MGNSSKKEQIENERLRQKNEERRLENERREREEENRKNNNIHKLRESQDISYFITLINEFMKNNDGKYAVKALEALNEKEIIRKYRDISQTSQKNINIIEEAVFSGSIKSKECIKKLLIILLLYEKERRGDFNDLFESCFQRSLNQIIFDILLHYDILFGNDIKFNNNYNNYKKFVIYSLYKGKYLNALNYLKNDIIQFNIILDLKEEIFKDIKYVSFDKLNSFDEANEKIQELIKYEIEKGKRLIILSKEFWESYYNYLYNQNYKIIKEKIQALLDLFRLYLRYIQLGDDTDYKYQLANKIHEFVQSEIIHKKDDIKAQLELLLKNDPYYIYDEYIKDPSIFENINILKLQKQAEIDYFQKIDIENIYGTSFKDYLVVIIKKAHNVADFTSILNLIKINSNENKKIYIELLIERYNAFEEINNESFMNLLKKVIEYSAEKKLNLLERILGKFGQNYQIYLDIMEEYNNDQNIMREISNISYEILEVDNIILLIKNTKEEKQKNNYFNNFKKKIISYSDFFIKDGSKNKNLKLLIELMRNGLIPYNNIYQKENEKCFSNENFYFKETQEILDILYGNLFAFKEKKIIYLDTILNEETDDIQKIFKQRFNLFKIIKGGNFNNEKEFNNLKDKYYNVEDCLNKSYEIANLLKLYFKKTREKEINKINKIYNCYLNKEKKVNIWINEEIYLNKYLREKENIDKAKLIKIIKEIELFRIIYSKYNEEMDENSKFEEAIKKFNECKYIFIDINKGDRQILDEWQKHFIKDENIMKEIKKLENYYQEYCQLEKKENKDIVKDILIFTKKNIYENDIKYLLNFIDLFQAEKTNLSNKLKEFKDEKNLNFEKLKEINKFLEDNEIYINNGKDDSPFIKLIRELKDKEEQIKFCKTKDVDSAAALIYRINPTNDSLKFKDILEYQNCVDFINDIKEKMKDTELFEKVRKKLEKDKIETVLASFQSYYQHYQSIKLLDSNYDGSDEIYQSIVAVLNNSKYTIELFKRKFNIYSDEEEEKKIKIKDLQGLIELKDNINLNFEELPFSNKVKDEDKKNLKEKKEKISKFVEYIEHLQAIIKLYTRLENKGCPFLIDITITALNGSVTYQLVNHKLEYKDLILKLKQYCDAMGEYQKKFYKENEYFRFVYEKQLFRLYKKIKRYNKDISSYIRYFTNGDSIEDEVPTFKIIFNDESLAYISYKISIESSFQMISEYIKHIFKINKTSLDDLYKGIKINESENLKGIYKCNIQKSKIDIFIIKMFLKLTGGFPIAQNVLLTNNETTFGEICSFMYRSIKCRYNTLFIISIGDNISSKNINTITNLLDEITNSMKNEDWKDIKPFILFVVSKTSNKSEGLLVRPDIKDLPEYLIKDILNYNIKNENSLNDSKSLSRSEILNNEIYNGIKIFTSECCGLGKSRLIMKKIEENGEEYQYLGIGDDITKDELFKKLKKLIKHKIKGKFKVGLHLDLFYTKNIPLMQYFLFSVLITKLYQVTDNIIYIPKKISIYIEIPNGPQNFMDDFPILKLFKGENITLSNQAKLEINDENLCKKLVWTNNKINSEEVEYKIGLNKSKENPMTYIEKKIYMNII